MYTEDLGELITDFSVLPLFADDTHDSQLLTSTTPSGVADVCRKLEQCVSAVHDWCTRRRLQLNPSKTEVIWFGSNANLDRLALTDVTICLDQATIHPLDCVRNLGSPAQQFTLHVSAHRKDRVDVLLPPLPTSQTTPCSGLREPKAVGVRVYSAAHRLLQRCACQLAGQCTCSTAAGAS